MIEDPNPAAPAPPAPAVGNTPWLAALIAAFHRAIAGPGLPGHPSPAPTPQPLPAGAANAQALGGLPVHHYGPGANMADGAPMGGALRGQPVSPFAPFEHPVPAPAAAPHAIAARRALGFRE